VHIFKTIYSNHYIVYLTRAAMESKIYSIVISTILAFALISAIPAIFVSVLAQGEGPGGTTTGGDSGTTGGMSGSDSGTTGGMTGSEGGMTGSEGGMTGDNTTGGMTGNEGETIGGGP
jgi:hypothetical protein